MSKWVVYAGATAALVVASAVLVGFLFETPARSGIWAGLAIAWLVQAMAFAILVFATRRRPKLVVAGWTLGTFLRLTALSVLAWLTLAGTLPLPAEPTLIALVLALFTLLLLEPVFFRFQVGTR